MGFDVSATHIVFFVAAIGLATVIAGTVSTSVGNLNNDIKDRTEALSDELATDIRIINDAADMPNNPLKLYVFNTGAQSIETSSTVVFVDGVVYTSLGLDVLASSDDETLRLDETLEVTVTGLNVAAGDHRAKVTMAHGVGDTIKFTI